MWILFKTLMLILKDLISLEMFLPVLLFILEVIHMYVYICVCWF